MLRRCPLKTILLSTLLSFSSVFKIFPIASETESNLSIGLWRYDSSQHSLETLTPHHQRLQIPLPSKAAKPDYAISCGHYVVIVTPEYTSKWLNWFYKPQSATKDLWIFNLNQRNWVYFPKVFASDPFQIIHFFEIQNMLVSDLLLEGDSPKEERKWVRFWINPQKHTIQTKVMRKGRILQIGVRSELANSAFRYAFILEEPSTLIKYDLLRNAEKSCQIPCVAKAFTLEPSNFSYREDDLKIIFKGVNHSLILRGSDLNPWPETPESLELARQH